MLLASVSGIVAVGAFFGSVWYHVRLGIEHPQIAFTLLVRNPSWLSERGRKFRRRFLVCNITFLAFGLLAAVLGGAARHLSA